MAAQAIPDVRKETLRNVTGSFTATSSTARRNGPTTITGPATRSTRIRLRFLAALQGVGARHSHIDFRQAPAQVPRRIRLPLEPSQAREPDVRRVAFSDLTATPRTASNHSRLTGLASSCLCSALAPNSHKGGLARGLVAGLIDRSFLSRFAPPEGRVQQSRCVRKRRRLDSWRIATMFSLCSDGVR
jgi:hypothetical protein